MNNEITVLIVEDDIPISNLLSITLKTHNYKYIKATDGNMALMMASSYNPDVIFLDLGLPDIDGIEIIKSIRSWSKVPIIVISARQELKDKIEALDAGADDYITKPFLVEELLARLRVAIRRKAQIINETVKKTYENGKLVVDFEQGCAYVNKVLLHLTPIEYKILCLLANNEGKVLTHNYITSNIWGQGWENNVGNLRVFMTTLRRKIEKEDKDNTYIQTHVGIGYRMLKVEN